MKSTISIQNAISANEPENTQEFRVRFGEYFGKQHPIVRGLHYLLMGVSIACVALSLICFVVAMYYTCLWAATGSFSSLGQATNLPIAWVTAGLSMSFLVFPWGLDSMLMRVFPAIVFPVRWYRSNKAIQYKTGIAAFFAGFGIMCAGAPGAVYFFNLATQALQKLF